MEQEMKEMKDKAGREKREADTKREELQSSKDKTAISKSKKGKAKATTIGKAKQTTKIPPACTGNTYPRRGPRQGGGERTPSGVAGEGMDGPFPLCPRRR
jgi:hypothetical protein